MAKKITMPESLVHKMLDALEFYADQGTYFAWIHRSDPPAGDWGSDFSQTELGRKPGKRARRVLEKVQKWALKEKGK